MEYHGLTYDEEQDIRVVPDPKDNRLGSFKAGWSEAEKGTEYTEETLQRLSWHNLGWRLGMLFDETPTELKEELYMWCVEQQKETKMLSDRL